MGDIETTLEFLIDLPLYQTEKPYMIQPSVDDKFDPNDPKLRNIEWELRPVSLYDIRGKDDYSLSTSGFSVIRHVSKHLSFANIYEKEEYRQETAGNLRVLLGAEHVKCYDCRVYKVLKTSHFPCLRARRFGRTSNLGQILTISTILCLWRDSHEVFTVRATRILSKSLRR